MNFKTREAVDLHIIDALDSSGAGDGRSEALALRYRLRDTGIPIVSHYAWDEKTLRAAIKRVASYRRAYVDPRKFLPFLHIACHGLPEGLVIGDDVCVPWQTLLILLLPLQKQVDYTLPLTLSSCHGFFGYRLALQEMKQFEKERPYYVLMGPQSSLSTHELISATSQLYRGLLHDFRGLPQAMRRANEQIKNSAAHLAYTYGANVRSKFVSKGVDDSKLFAPPLRMSKAV